eukprot:m.731452 g.731452  ORF g.731452 m.731452 type:complete len:159 (+) comp58872_c0_seq9:2755-3231(+)
MRYLSTGSQAKPFTMLECASNFASVCINFVFQTMMVLWTPHEANRVLSGHQARPNTSCSWSLKILATRQSSVPTSVAPNSRWRGGSTVVQCRPFRSQVEQRVEKERTCSELPKHDFVVITSRRKILCAWRPSHDIHALQVGGQDSQQLRDCRILLCLL